MTDSDIDVGSCRGRQKRLLAEMERLELDWVVVTQREHVQWLAGPRYAWMFQPSAALSADGQMIVVAPNSRPDPCAADVLLSYEAQWDATLRNDQRRASITVLRSALPQSLAGRIGVESSTFPLDLFDPKVEWVDIEGPLYRLRRRKDRDELGLLMKAIAATEKMYERAREIIEPGVMELDVFNQLQAVAVDELGEMLTGTGNDYQCGSAGGPPRAGRRAAAGELYILDLGPAYRGYFADNCRTIAVTDPTEVQLKAWSEVVQVFELVESSVRAGTRAAEIYNQVRGRLDMAATGRFTHHLGHGIGLFPHEAPHLNAHWDDRFEVGDVFTVEPGLYAPELNAGLRIENNYVVTETGVICLTSFPMEY